MGSIRAMTLALQMILASENFYLSSSLKVLFLMIMSHRVLPDKVFQFWYLILCTQNCKILIPLGLR